MATHGQNDATNLYPFFLIHNIFPQKLTSRCQLSTLFIKKKEIIEKLAQSTASKVRDRANRYIIAKFYN